MAFYKINISEVKPVCGRKCPDRTWDCHKKCERYKAYREECDKAMQERFQKNQLEHEADSAAYEAMKRMPGKRSV